MSADQEVLGLSDGHQLPYRVQRRDIQHPKLRLDPDGSLVVIAPDVLRSHDLIVQHTDWIASQYDKQLQSLEQISDKYGDLTAGFTLWGRSYRPKVKHGKYDIQIKEEVLKIFTPDGADSYTFLYSRLKEAVRTAVRTLAESFSADLGEQVDSISIRSQQTKWASCSTNCGLNFNVRSAFLPFNHFQYLVAHEVAHLKFPNHSDEFWDLVESLVPDYERYRSELQGFWYAVHRNSEWTTLLQK